GGASGVGAAGPGPGRVVAAGCAWRGGVTVSGWLREAAGLPGCGEFLRVVQACLAVGQPSLVAGIAGDVPLLASPGWGLAQRRPGGPAEAAGVQGLDDDDVAGALLLPVQH